MQSGGGAAAGATERRPVGSDDDLPEVVREEELRAALAAPRWLNQLGRTAWLLVGVFLLLVGLVWFLAATYTIGGPVVVASIVAAITMPAVSRMARHMPRALAAVLVLLSLVAIAVVIAILVISGITGQHDQIAQEASKAADKGQSWLQSLGVNSSGASSAKESAKADVPKILSTLIEGVVDGIRGLTSIIFGLSLAALSLFFLLKDGPVLRAWVDRHLGVPQATAQVITGNLIRSLRGYFRGVTLVAAFNGIVVGIGSLLLGVPLAGTIAVVTFVAAYVPFVGAFVAGAFAVIIALGAKGTTTALIMLLIVILANGLLQNVFQPFAMGTALDLHPLVVLVVTIASGCLFGTLGLILAAPLLSAAVHATRELAAARAQVPEAPV